MRLTPSLAALIAVCGMAVGYGVAHAQAPAAPTEEQMRQAVANLHGDRIARPASYEELTADQKAFVKSILSGPRRGIDGALGIMMVSPVMGDLAQKAIAYGRFNPSVPPRLNELAILIGARAWSAQYAWYAHHRAALTAGLPADVIDAIQHRRRPAAMSADVEAVYNFSTELLTTKQVSDETLRAAKSVLGGDKGVVDLVGTLGFYQFVAMLMNVDRLPLPPNVKAELD